MIFFTYFFLKLILKCETYLPEWAKLNGFRILRKEYRLMWNVGWFRILVEDGSGNKRSGWVTFGLFSGKDKAVWDEKLWEG